MTKVDLSDDKPLPYLNDGPYWEAREAYYSNWNFCLKCKPKPEEIPMLRKKLFEENGTMGYCVSESTNNSLQMSTLILAVINVILHIVLVVFTFLVSTVCDVDKIFASIWLFTNVLLIMLYGLYRFSDNCCGKPKNEGPRAFQLAISGFIISICSFQLFFQLVCQLSPRVCALSSWALINPRPENVVVKGLYATCFSLNGVLLILVLACTAIWMHKVTYSNIQQGAKRIPLELREFFVNTYSRVQAEMIDKYTGLYGGYYTCNARFYSA